MSNLPDPSTRSRSSYRQKEGTRQRLEALIVSDPEAAAKLLRELSGSMLKPHEGGQKEVLEAEERFQILNAGRRWGKTKVGAAKALREARIEGKRVAWVAPIYKNVKRGYEEILSQLPKGLLSQPAPPVGGFDAGRAIALHFKNGSRLEFYSAERPEGMLGASFDYAVLDEAATMPEHVWNQVIRPTLADRSGGALMISTPRGKNWFYRLWTLGQDELNDEYRSWTFPSMANPTIPEREWEEMRSTMPAVTFEQEVLAEFVSKSAQVFRIPDEAYVPLHPPAGHVIMGIDLAKQRDFSVLYGVRAGDRRPCYHDRFTAVNWPEQRRRIHAAIAKLEREGATGVTVMLDSTGLGDVVFDDLEYEGLDVVPVKFTQQWKQMAVSLLAADLERGDAFLIEEQREEFEGYGYTISESTGRWKYEAMSGHDDQVSAALLAHWGIVHTGVPDIEMITAGPQGQLPPAAENDDFGEYVEGEVVYEEIVADSADDLMQNPDVWI